MTEFRNLKSDKNEPVTSPELTEFPNLKSEKHEPVTSPELAQGCIDKFIIYADFYCQPKQCLFGNSQLMAHSS